MYPKAYLITTSPAWAQTLLIAGSLGILTGLLTYYWPHWADCWRLLWH